MEADFAVTEAPDIAVDAGADVEAPDADIDTGETSPITETSEPLEPEAQPDQQEAPKDFRAVVDGRLSPQAKATIDKLRAENPQLAKAVQRALFAEDRLRREIPGGFKEVQDLRSKIEELGGDVGLQEMRGEVDGWREFDQLYSAGDPKVLEFLTETPEAQQAFLKIAPIAFEKYRESHPEGYSAYVSQVFVADMQEQGIPLLLERLGDFLGDNPKATEIWQKIAGYVNRINGFARKQVAPPKIESKAADPKQAEFQQRETEFTRKEWSQDTASRHSNLFSSQWKSQIGDRKLSDTQVATIKELYGLKLQAILKAKPDFNQNLERYFNARQKDGFIRYFESVYKDAVPRALRTAIQQVGVGAKPGPKPGEARPGQPPAKPVVTPNGAPAANAGYAFTAAKPNMNMVNRELTTPIMWQEGKAILRDGRKVFWRK